MNIESAKMKKRKNERRTKYRKNVRESDEGMDGGMLHHNKNKHSISNVHSFTVYYHVVLVLSPDYDHSATVLLRLKFDF